MFKTIEGKAAILVIDIQYDFIKEDGPIPIFGGWDIIPPLNRLNAAARKAGIPIIFFQEFHRKDMLDFGRELDGAQPVHCLEGTEGVELVKELNIEEGDYIMTKPRYNGFIGTDLQLVLNGWGVLPGDTLIIVGVATNGCLYHTTVHAHQLDYRIRVVEECSAAHSLEKHEAALAALEYRQTGCRVKLEEMLDAIAKYKK